jgi:hypothetical protein
MLAFCYMGHVTFLHFTYTMGVFARAKHHQRAYEQAVELYETRRALCLKRLRVWFELLVWKPTAA